MASQRVEQNLRNIITNLSHLSEQSSTAATTLSELINVLNQLEGTRITGSFDALATSINKVSVGLRELGVNAPAVAKLRNELLQVAATEARLPEVMNIRRQAIAGSPSGYFQSEKARNADLIEGLLRAQTAEKGVAAAISDEVEQRRLSLSQAEKQLLVDRARADAIRGMINALGDRRGILRAAGTGLPEGQVSNRFPEKGLLPVSQISNIEGLIPGGSAGLLNFQQALDKLKLTAGQIHKPIIDAATGMQFMTVEATNSAGAMVKAQVVMDRYGNVLSNTSRKFQSFTGGIIRDTLEVIKWTVAIGLVYTPIRVLNQLISESIELQTSLAEAQIVLSETTQGITGVFEAAARIAKETGTSLTGVLAGYNEAAAATASIGDEAERTVATQVLLKDSMILSQLAGIEQAEALDTLVGALRQAKLELTDGSQIMDSWIAVSKNANVSINTLASTYAIVGTAAEDAGISFDALNGMAAALAEATKLSADETGNALRGFISGVQSPQAETALASFGIAVRDVNGQMRSFTEIMAEIISLRDKGFLSPEDVQEITNIVGGGFRRGAQLATLLGVDQRTLELTEVSLTASGDAAEAMGIKLDTVAVAIQQLQNALTGLAQTLGQEGGILSTITLIVQGLTLFVDALNSVVRGIGDATPVIAGLLLTVGLLDFTKAGQALNRPLPLGVANLLGGAGAQRLALAGKLPTGRGYLPGQGLDPTIGQGLSFLDQGFRGTGLSKLLGGTGLLGAAIPAIAAGGSIVSGLAAGGGREQERDFARAGGQIAGAIAGGLISQGNPIGIAIGTVIGGAFVDTATKDLTSISQEIERLRTIQPAPETAQERVQTRLEELEGIIEPGFANEFNLRLLSGIGNIFGAKEITPETLRLGQLQAASGQDIGGGGGIGGFLANRLLGRDQITEEQLAAYREILQIREDLGKLDEGAFTPISAGRADEIERASKIAGSQFYEQQLQRFQRGESGIGVRQLQEAEQLIGRLDNQARTFVSAFDTAGINEDLNSLLDVLLNISDEERTRLNTLANDVLLTKKALDEGTGSAEAFNLAVSNFGQLYGATSLQVETRLTQVPGVIELGDVSQRQAQTTIQIAEQLQEEWFDAIELATGQKLPEHIREELRDRGEDAMLAIGEGVERSFLDFTTKVPQKFIQEALQEQGLGTGFRSIGFQDFRGKGLSTADVPRLEAMEQAIANSLIAATGGAFQPSRQDTAIIFEDGIDTLHVDLSLLNLAMQDLIEINQEQLEGIFNIPEGMTAFIPATPGIYFSDTPFPRGGGGGGLTNLPLPGRGAVDDRTIQKSIDRELSTTSKNLIAQTILGFQLANDRSATGEVYNPLILQKIGDVFGKSLDSSLKTSGTPINQPERWLASDIGPDVQRFFEGVIANMPSSIPVTINTALEATIPIIIDGSQIMQTLQKRLFNDFKTAKKRTGTVGYIVE